MNKIKCPECDSKDIYIFKRKCILLNCSGKHYGCKNCRLVFNEAYIERMRENNKCTK